MRLEDLQVFSVLAQLGNLRRTADKVGLTQSAVTKVLHRLEAELGLPLVERRTRGAVLTPAGTTLLERATALGSAVKDLRAVDRRPQALPRHCRRGNQLAIVRGRPTAFRHDLHPRPADSRFSPSFALDLGNHVPVTTTRRGELS